MMDLEKKVRRSHIQQLGNTDCGATCLAIIVKFFGGEVSLEHLRRVCGTTREGTTILGLFQGAKKIGLDASPLKAKENSLAI